MAGGCNCNGACTCAFLSSGSIQVTGVGSATNPFRAAMRASAEAGNRFSVLADGGFVGPQLIYLPNGAVLEPGEDGGLTLPPPCILDYNGDPIPADEDGCVQLPTSGAPPDFACGLDTVAETGALKVATTDTWPMLDLFGQPFGGTDLDAGGTICDGDGQVRTLPQGTAAYESMSNSNVLEAIQPIPDGGAYTSDPSDAVILFNPSPARSMVVSALLTATADVVVPPNSGTEVRLQARVNGGGWTTRRELRYPENQDPDAPSIRSLLPLHSMLTTTVGPEDSVVIELRLVATNSEAGDPGVVGQYSFGAVAVGVNR